MNERTTPAEQREHHLMDGLDYYKLTMGQLIHAKHPDADVTFTMKNRSPAPLSQYVAQEQLTERIADIRTQGFTQEEVAYLRTLESSDGHSRFAEPYLNHLEHIDLPEVAISQSTLSGDFDIHTHGDWPTVSLWETVVMSELNQLYYEGKIAAEDLSLSKIYDEGDRRLSEKISRLQDRPDIKFSDFGSRRRFSSQWHEHVVARLAEELPDSFIGTSNPWLARAYDLTPVGTYAHEMPMVYAALSDQACGDPLAGHARMLEDWRQYYQGDLSIALSDTFTTDYFLHEFGEHGAVQWQGLRHDSGDPFEFGEKVIGFYRHNGVNPQERTIVFSDGLDIDKIITLADYFKNNINVLFGWGTSLTNDLGLAANNFVMKATAVGDTSTVKLSDTQGKHTGTPEQVERYINLKNSKLATSSVLSGVQ